MFHTEYIFFRFERFHEAITKDTTMKKNVSESLVVNKYTKYCSINVLVETV